MAETTDLFEYDPSVAAAIIFAVLFGIAMVTHAYQLIRTRTWFMLAFLIGGICEYPRAHPSIINSRQPAKNFSPLVEFGGYIARVFTAQETPNWSIGPFIIQHLLLLVAPALLAASIYMELGRIILLVHGEKHSIISRIWLTKIFVGGDIVSFLAQAIGKSKPAIPQKST
jgi:hypothetical protein